MQTMDNLLRRLYYDINSSACFAGANTLYAHAKRVDARIKYKDVTEFLEYQYPYSLHKPVRIHFPRNRVIATGKDSHWQADLCDMKSLKTYNNGNTFMLTVVDVLSKFGFAEPVKNKTPKEVSEAFRKIMKCSQRRPWFLMTDKGNEFRGEFEAFAEANDIQHYFAHSPLIKAPNVERYNRTLKTRLWKYFAQHNTKKYIDVLQQIVAAINNRYCRPIKMQPSQVTFKNEQEVWHRLYGGAGTPAKFKYSIGDRVRIALQRKTFHKGYLPGFTKEIYVITHCLARNPPVYRLKEEAANDQIAGVFYREELTRAIEKA